MPVARLAKTLPAINGLQTIGSLGRQHPPWILGGKSADLIQLPKLVLAECDFDRSKIVLKLVEVFAPMMTEVTTVFARSHASERRAGLHPCAFAIGAITSRIFQVRSLSTTGKSKSVRRESAGFWFVRLNLPESKPPASGLHTSRPTFSDSSMGMISRSRSRPAIE